MPAEVGRRCPGGHAQDHRFGWASRPQWPHGSDVAGRGRRAAHAPFVTAHSSVARATSGERPGPWWPPSSRAMKCVGAASTAARRSLCANGHRFVVTGVREEHARQAARRGDQVESPQIRPQGDCVEAAVVLAVGVAGCAPAARGRRGRRAGTARPPGTAAPASGTAAGGRAPPAAGSTLPCWRPRAASHGAPLAARSASPAATASCQPSGPSTPSLSPWPRKSKVSAASPAAAACSPMMPWFSLRLPAPWHTSKAPRGRPAGRKSRPASSSPSEAMQSRSGAGVDEVFTPRV